MTDRIRRPALSMLSMTPALLATALLATACGSRPIPLSARAGTTFAIALPAAFWSHLPGFGRAAQQAFGPASTVPDDLTTGLPTAANAPFDPASGLEDPQRGELAIKLYNATDAFWLPVRYVTRVRSSPASDAGLDGRILSGGELYGTTPADIAQEGQVVALVDIPAAVPQGSYQFRVALIRRNATTGDFELVKTSKGWGEPGSDELYVMAADQGPAAPPAEPTPLRGIFNGFEASEQATRENLDALVPNPVALVAFVDTTGSETLIYTPAATTLEVLYPDELVEVVGVVPTYESGAGSIIRWSAQALEGEPPGCDHRAKLVIHAADPDLQMESVGIAFRLRDPFGACPGVAETSDFEIASAAAYDIDGNPMSEFNVEVGFIY